MKRFWIVTILLILILFFVYLVFFTSFSFGGSKYCQQDFECQKITGGILGGCWSQKPIKIGLVDIALSLPSFDCHCSEYNQCEIKPVVEEEEKVLSTEEADKQDLIILDSVHAGDYISSPLTITGQARGVWFFEASFPVFLVNWDGLIIAQGIATAQDDWMTEDFVPFEATLEFEIPEYKNNGALIFKKDNPSGLPEYDDALEIPIFFEESKEVKDCLPQQRNTDFCIEVYQPVCANVRVQCIRAPCPEVKETFSNSCEACKNGLVYTYTEGACSN